MSNPLTDIASADLGKLHKFESQFFTARKMRRYGLALVAIHLFGLALTVFNGHGLYRPDGRLNCIDFGFIWLSGKFAASADPAQVYDLGIFGAAQTNFFGPGNCILIQHFDYPPVLLFYTYLLGLMPYLAAFAMWNIVLLVLYLSVSYGIMQRANAIIGALTPLAALRDLQLGHNGFLTAGLMGWSLVLLERWPLPAGLVLGLLTYKPQFGLLFPIAFLASRNWRALAGATVSSLALAVGAAAAFGAETWPSFLSALSGRNASLSPDATVSLQLQSIYGLLQWTGVSVPFAASIHGLIAIMVAVAVWVVWSKPIPHALRASMLCIGSLLVNPYLLQYDFCVLTIAVAFLIRDGLSRGFLPGELSSVALGWVTLDFLRPGPIIFCAILLTIFYRRVMTLKLVAVAGAWNRAPNPNRHRIRSPWGSWRLFSYSRLAAILARRPFP